jgi:hypothetical protein
MQHMKQQTKEKKAKPPKIKKREKPGRGITALAVTAFVLALAAIGGGAYYVCTERQATARRAEDMDNIAGRIEFLEEAAAIEKNRESIVIQMEPHALVAYMADSAYLYKTQFSSVRYESGAEASALVKLRVPLTVTVYNCGDQTVTVENAVLYPWETVFEEGFRQETLAAQQRKGFFGEVARGQRDGFSVAPGESRVIEIDARLRGVYGHPALEAETQRFLTDFFADPENEAPNPDGDVPAEGRGAMNGGVNTLFREALASYCARRNTSFTLTYKVKTGRGNTFSATCAGL